MHTIKMYKPAAIFLIAVAIMTVVSNLAAAHAAPAAPQPQSTAAAELEDLLLNPDEYAAITGANSARTRITHGPDTQLYNSTAKMHSHPACASVYALVEQSSYAGSGYRDLVFTVLSDGGVSAMSQAVVRFPDRGHASTYAKDLTKQWADCANREVTYTDSGGVSRWQVGEPTATRNKVLVIPVWSAAGDLACQHAAKAAGEIFITALSCGPEATDYAEAAVMAIAGKVGSDL